MVSGITACGTLLATLDNASATGTVCAESKLLCEKKGYCLTEEQLRMLCLTDDEIKSYLADFERRTFAESRKIYKLPALRTQFVFQDSIHARGTDHYIELARWLFVATGVRFSNALRFDSANPLTSRLSINVVDELGAEQVQRLLTASQFTQIHYAERRNPEIGLYCAIVSFGASGNIRETFALIKDLETNPEGWPVSGSKENSCYITAFYQHLGQLNILAAEESAFQVDGKLIGKASARHDAIYHLYKSNVAAGTDAPEALKIVEQFIRREKEK
jgi:hypothetical protein